MSQIEATIMENQSQGQQDHQQQMQASQQALNLVTSCTCAVTSDLEKRGHELDVFLKQELRKDINTGKFRGVQLFCKLSFLQCSGKYFIFNFNPLL